MTSLVGYALAFLDASRVKKVVLAQARQEKNIIFGGQAVNKQVNAFLQRQTTSDWDIFSKHPKKSAFIAERKLDRISGGDFYSTEPARHEGTWRVRGNVSGRGIADYSPLEANTPFVTINGIRYTKLDWEAKRREEILRQKKARWRWEKSREDLRRLEAQKKLAELKKRYG